jgi:antitoxin HicB
VEKRKTISAHFYKTSSGKMPVREWLLSLPKDDRIEIGGVSGSRPCPESKKGDGGIRMINKKHVGQEFEDFLQEEGIYEQVQLNALKKTLAHQIKAMMEERGIPKTEMASRMNTSRSSLDRLLNENSYNVTIGTISKAATVLGKRIELSLIDNG